MVSPIHFCVYTFTLIYLSLHAGRCADKHTGKEKTVTEPILKPQQLQVEDSQILQISHSPNGRRLQRPLKLQLPQASSKGEMNLQRWVIDALSWKMPALVEFTLQSQTATELAKRVMLSNSGSKATLYQYIYGVYRYCTYLGKRPDALLSECLQPNGEPVTTTVNHHAKQLDGFVMELKASGLAPGTISNHLNYCGVE